MASRQLDLAPTAEVKDLTSGLLAVIARAASDPNTDVDKLERLLLMQERVLAKEAEQAFNGAMRAAQDEIRPVVKNKKNTSTKSSYADLEALAAAMDPIIHRHGFAPSFGTAESPLPAHYRVTCALAHSAGHTRDYFADVPIDDKGPKGEKNKTATHGFGSALSYGRRYLKMLIFDVALTDDDGNAAGRGATITETQEGDLEALIQEVNADRGRFLTFLKIDRLCDLPAKDYRRAVAALENVRGK